MFVKNYLEAYTLLFSGLNMPAGWEWNYFFNLFIKLRMINPLVIQQSWIWTSSVLKQLEMKKRDKLQYATHKHTMGREINFWGGVRCLTLMVSDRGRTTGWCWCCTTEYSEYSVSLKKMLVIPVLTFLNRVLVEQKIVKLLSYCRSRSLSSHHITPTFTNFDKKKWAITI